MSAHINVLVKLSKGRNNDIHSLRKFMMISNRTYAACHHLESKQAPMGR